MFLKRCWKHPIYIRLHMSHFRELESASFCWNAQLVVPQVTTIWGIGSRTSLSLLMRRVYQLDLMTLVSMVWFNFWFISVIFVGILDVTGKNLLALVGNVFVAPLLSGHTSYCLLDTLRNMGNGITCCSLRW